MYTFAGHLANVYISWLCTLAVPYTWCRKANWDSRKARFSGQVSHRFASFLTVFHCFLMFLTVWDHFSLFYTISHHFSAFLIAVHRPLRSLRPFLILRPLQNFVNSWVSRISWDPTTGSNMPSALGLVENNMTQGYQIWYWWVMLNVFTSCYLNQWFCKFGYISVSTLDLLGPG